MCVQNVLPGWDDLGEDSCQDGIFPESRLSEIDDPRQVFKKSGHKVKSSFYSDNSDYNNNEAEGSAEPVA